MGVGGGSVLLRVGSVLRLGGVGGWARTRFSVYQGSFCTLPEPIPAKLLHCKVAAVRGQLSINVYRVYKPINVYRV